jgi:hypothetical protein
MILGALGTYLILMGIFFEFTILPTVSFTI